MAEPQKDQSVETLRGLAILLMVAGHVTEFATLELGHTGSVYAYAGYSFNFVRMPLFTVISGFVYALRPLQPQQVRQFLRGKARRLLLPLLTGIPLLWLVAMWAGRDVPGASEAWRLYVYPLGHFWFLAAIAWVFVAVAVLEVRGQLNSLRSCSVALAISVLLLLALAEAFGRWPGPWWWIASWYWGLYLLPFFLLGLMLARFTRLTGLRGVVPISAAVVILGTALHQLNYFGSIDIAVFKTTRLGIAVGLTSTLLLFRFRRTFRPLAWIGKYAFTVYLFHPVGVVLAYKIVSESPTFPSAHLFFWCALVTGVTVPLAAHTVLIRLKLTRRLLLGLR